MWRNTINLNITALLIHKYLNGSARPIRNEKTGCWMLIKSGMGKGSLEPRSMAVIRIKIQNGVWWHAHVLRTCSSKSFLRAVSLDKWSFFKEVFNLPGFHCAVSTNVKITPLISPWKRLQRKHRHKDQNFCFFLCLCLHWGSFQNEMRDVILTKKLSLRKKLLREWLTERTQF